jgi:uncharacterized membrane protein YkvA (DUF1232 family)
LEKNLAKFFDLLPVSLRNMVERHVQELDGATASYLADELDVYLQKVGLESRHNQAIDLELVQRMVAALKKLLEGFRSFTDAERMVISAAVRYFLDENDARQDFSDRFGFDDDLAVLNAALLAIGREDMLVVRVRG